MGYLLLACVAHRNECQAEHTLKGKPTIHDMAFGFMHT